MEKFGGGWSGRVWWIKLDSALDLGRDRSKERGLSDVRVKFGEL